MARKTQKLGDLPVEIINRTLQMELEGGDVILTVTEQRHVRNRHRNDYELCHPHLAGIVARPLYAGEDHKHPGKVCLVGGLPGATGDFCLIAISLEVTERGDYRVHTFYPMTREQVLRKRHAGKLKIVVRVYEMDEAPVG